MNESSNARAFDYLDHMAEAITLATSFTEGMAKPDFLADRKTQQAVILNLIVIGEAASKIAAEFPEFASAAPQLALAANARYAQSHGPRLLRHRSRRGLGNRTDIFAYTAATNRRDRQIALIA